MPPTIPHPIVLIRPLLLLGLLLAAASAGGCAQGQFIAHATIDWPGASQRQMDEVIAKPVGQRLFGATNGVVSVTAISSAGKVELYAVSDGLTKVAPFVQAVGGSLDDSSGTLPRGAVTGPLDVLPKGQPIPEAPIRSVGELKIDIDRNKLIDAGLSYDDIAKAVAKAREEDPAFGAAPNASTTASADGMIRALKATTLPSKTTPITLGDVAHIHVVGVPDTIERHWP